MMTLVTLNVKWVVGFQTGYPSIYSNHKDGLKSVRAPNSNLSFSKAVVLSIMSFIHTIKFAALKVKLELHKAHSGQKGLVNKLSLE